MGRPSEDWRAALDEALGVRVTMVIGASDAGKTTLVMTLAGELAALGARVGVVDADLGQSEIGPPATVGLGRVSAPIDRLSEATLAALHFVGVTSPGRDLRGTVEGARRMTARARADGLERILVDTSGLVTGWHGRLLKERKIAVLDPDLVLVLARGDECEPIVRPFEGATRPRIVRLAARGSPRSRSQAERRRHRTAAFDAYLSDARPVTIDRSAVTVAVPAGRELSECVGALCALDDAQGDTLAVGVVRQIAEDALRILAPLEHGGLPPGPPYAPALAPPRQVRGALRDSATLLAGVTAVRIGWERIDGRRGRRP